MLTGGKDKLDASDCFPAGGIIRRRVSLIHAGGDDRSGIEEELERHDHQAAELGWYDLRLVCASADIASSALNSRTGTAGRIDLRDAHLHESHRNIYHNAADDELCNSPSLAASAGDTKFDCRPASQPGL